jgi:hypothetical protein
LASGFIRGRCSPSPPSLLTRTLADTLSKAGSVAKPKKTAKNHAAPLGLEATLWAAADKSGAPRIVALTP